MFFDKNIQIFVLFKQLQTDETIKIDRHISPTMVNRSQVRAKLNVLKVHTFSRKILACTLSQEAVIMRYPTPHTRYPGV